MKVVSGNPDPKHVSMSYVERQNPALWKTKMNHYPHFRNLDNFGFSDTLLKGLSVPRHRQDRPWRKLFEM